MSGEKPTPDVIVVGMPSCGKTVFFTVLGKKFMNLVEGRRSAPLGFRLETCEEDEDDDTLKVINDAYDRLRSGKWPEPTGVGQIMPLGWDVFTGRRHIFKLLSMDLAGETFMKAFGIKDKDGVYGEKAKVQSSALKSDVVSDSGDELYRDKSAPDDSSASDVRETAEDKTAEMLKGAIKTAKVVCFLVNISHPDRMTGDEINDIELFRFRSSVSNIYRSLKRSRELREKSLIVLTQAHLHQGEIEREGGPVMYLGSAEVYGGDGAQLSNLAKGYGIPVIAVSSINEKARGKLPAIRSVDDISSSGLFGFLLTVSGMVVRDDSLCGVKDAYLAYQRERVEYLRCPGQMVKTRLDQARKYHDAANAFLSACDRYLDDGGNLAGRSGDVGLSPSDRENYKLFTRNDPDVKAASEYEYIVRDELWDRALRRAVVAGSQTSVADVYNDVRSGLEKSFPDKVGNRNNENFVCGFGEDDLLSGSEASTYEKWIELNLREYEKDFESTLANLDELKKSTIKVLESLQSCVGKDSFGSCRTLAEKLCREFETRLSEFRSQWIDGGAGAIPKVKRMEEVVAEKIGRISEYCREHERIKNEEMERRRQLENERRENERTRQAEVESACRRRRIVIFLLLLLSGGASLLIAAHCYHKEKNKNAVEAICRAVARSDYDGARRLYDSMKTIGWLGVDRDDRLCQDFAGRLMLAGKFHAVRQSIEKSKSRLDLLCGWLDEADAEPEELAEARSQRDSALASYCVLPPLTMSLDSILQSDVNFGSMIAVSEQCEVLLTNSIGVIEKVQGRWRDKRRKLCFKREMQEAETLLEQVSVDVGDMDMTSVANCIERIERHKQSLRELSGNDEAAARNATKFAEKADSILNEMKTRQAALRKRMLAGVLSDVQLAMVSNSVDLAWGKFNLAQEMTSVMPSDETKSKELEKLRAQLQEFTVKANEGCLSKIVGEIEGFSKDIVISDRLLEGLRKSLGRLEEVRIGLWQRIPEESDAFKRIESQIESVRTMLPVIVQIEGIDPGCGTAVDLEKSGSSSEFMDGVSPETQKRCVYLLVRMGEYSSGSSRFVKVVDAAGNVHHLAISLSKLAPGINRVNLKGQPIDRKVNEE